MHLPNRVPHACSWVLQHCDGVWECVCGCVCAWGECAAGLSHTKTPSLSSSSSSSSLLLASDIKCPKALQGTHRRGPTTTPSPPPPTPLPLGRPLAASHCLYPGCLRVLWRDHHQQTPPARVRSYLVVGVVASVLKLQKRLLKVLHVSHDDIRPLKQAAPQGRQRRCTRCIVMDN